MTTWHLPRRTPRPAGAHRAGGPAVLTRPSPVIDAGVTKALEPIRDALGGGAPLTDDLLTRVRDGIRATMGLPGDALPADPADVPAPAALPVPRPAPMAAAQLRAVIGGRNRIHDPLGDLPAYAGWGILPDGRAVAGMFLGSNDDGHYVLDVTDLAWCDAAIEALGRVRDELTGAADAGEGDAA